MHTNDQSFNDIIERLKYLKNMEAGPLKYYESLAHDKDLVIAVAAANILIDQGIAGDPVFERLVELSRFQSIRIKAFTYFLDTANYDYAYRLINPEFKDTPPSTSSWLSAIYFDKSQELADIELEKFFRTGDIEAIAKSAKALEAFGGYRSALPLYASLILVNPQNSAWVTNFYHLLYSANCYEELAEAANLFDEIGIFPNITKINRAAIDIERNQPRKALESLNLVQPGKLNPFNQNFRLELIAKANEKMSQYQLAYQAYCDLKLRLQPQKFDRNAFKHHITAQSEYNIIDAGTESRFDIVSMLGFPRSGTTLLENIFAAHPELETFEEIPAFASLRMILARNHREANVLTAAMIDRARQAYYDEIDRRKRNDRAKKLIDKMPIQSAQARLLKKIFPNHKYIFSIRHPYDVVLSCFKQPFKPNLPMNNFTTFETSCETYDFVMSEWFSTFTLDDKNVCYIKYDDLVTNMQPTMEQAFSFLEVGWNDAVNNFSKFAEERQVKTPSYAKVRQGLSIGVQSSWKNYQFLFEKPEARVLDKWVNFFGYSTN